MLKTIKIDFDKILKFVIITLSVFLVHLILRIISYHIDAPADVTVRTIAFVLKRISIASLIATVACFLTELLRNEAVYELIIKRHGIITTAVIVVLSIAAGFIPRSLGITYICQVALIFVLVLGTPSEEKSDKIILTSLIASVVIATIVSFLASGCSTVEHFVIWQNVSELSYIEGLWGTY